MTYATSPENILAVKADVKSGSAGAEAIPDVTTLRLTKWQECEDKVKEYQERGFELIIGGERSLTTKRTNSLGKTKELADYQEAAREELYTRMLSIQYFREKGAYSKETLLERFFVAFIWFDDMSSCVYLPSWNVLVRERKVSKPEETPTTV
jgi:hypothetical protein